MAADSAANGVACSLNIEDGRLDSVLQKRSQEFYTQSAGLWFGLEKGLVEFLFKVDIVICEFWSVSAQYSYCNIT